MGAVAGQPPLGYDPRYLLFEYLFNLVLRKQQVELLRGFLEAGARGDGSLVQQLIMGAGVCVRVRECVFICLL